MSTFKNNTTGMTPLHNEIHQMMISVAADYEQLNQGERSGRWVTREIKNRMGNIGASLGFNSYSTEHAGEWLFDQIWFTESEKGHMCSVEMCLESELSGRSKASLKVDFEKLKLANAKLKVFICHAEGNFKDPDNVNNVIDFLNESMEAMNSEFNRGSTLVLIWEDYNSGEIVPHLM